MPHRSRWISRALAGGVVVALGAAACTSSTPEATSTSAGVSTAGTGSTAATSTPVDTSTAPLPSTATSTSPTSPPATRTPPTSTTTRATPAPTQPAGPVTLLSDLDIAWSVVVLPDGSALVSERNTGRVHHVPKPGTGGKASVAGRLPIFRAEG